MRVTVSMPDGGRMVIRMPIAMWTPEHLTAMLAGLDHLPISRAYVS